MFRSNDLLVETLVRDRERQALRCAALTALLREERGERAPRRSVRERLGFVLIQAGRALVRQGAAYGTASRRLA